MDEASGFFETPTMAQHPRQGMFELVSSSPESYCDIWRADKDGRFRIYKALKSEYAGDQVYERLLRKEFEIGYSLDHPNICEYYAFVNLPPLGNCIEMEWIDGCSLDSLLPRGAVGKTLAVKIINETCDALSYMHSKQVVHRDLKPSNIMLTYNGNNVKLIDFGLSDTDAHSVLKGSAGTQVYASPELISGKTVDFRSDIFSLGCVIDRLSPTYARVARKCCQRAPAKRFQSALDVKKAIERKPLAPFAVAAVALVLLGSALWLTHPWSRPAGDVAGLPSLTDTPPGTSEDSPALSPASLPIDNQTGAEQQMGRIEDFDKSGLNEPSARTKGDSPGGAKEDSPGRPKNRTPEKPMNRTPEKPEKMDNAPKKSQQSDKEAIDELFRQATELFDQ
ncbi:MAG: serine/threonine-protein kinase [Candidatus Cryptobacteroides sp.]|nr:serine/threonine-protein kinase [Candidatus Cryptobacteroides sp.]